MESISSFPLLSSDETNEECLFPIVEEISYPFPECNNEYSAVSPFKFVYNLSYFDYCRLSEVKDKPSLKCLICWKERNKKVTTTTFCKTCNLICCLECYDYHRKKQFICSLRKLQRKNQMSFKVSACGNFFEAIPKLAKDGPNFFERQDINIISNEVKNLNKNVSQANFLQNSVALVPVLNALNFGNIKQAVSLLKDTYAAVSDVLFDDSGNFKCIYFQDSYMKDFFNFYPKRVCIDVTCTLPALSVFVYLFLSEDSNGQSEIISVALLSTEDSESLTWLLSTFKKHNPSWRKIKMLAADTLIRNREILRLMFPEANMIVCFFHSTRTFRNDLDNPEFFCLTDDEKANITKHFEKMILVYGEMEYSLLYQQLFSMYEPIREYFDKNWHPTRNEWRIRMEYCDNVLHAINSFLNFIANSVKPVVLLAQSNVCEFIKKMFVILKLLRFERNYKNSTTFQSAQLSLYSKFTPQYHISSVLTPYSAEIVIHQLDMSADIHINPGALLESYVFSRYGTTAISNSCSCTCKFFLLTSLFCCHIFAVRRVLSLSVFDESQCDFYWTQKYFQDAHISLEENFTQNVKNADCMFKVIDKILPIVMRDSHFFQQRISLLGQLVLLWKKEEEIYLQFDGSETAESDKPHNFMDTTNIYSASCSNVKEVSINSDYLNFTSQQTDNLFNLPENNEKESKPSFLSIDCWFGRHLLEGSHINFIYLSQVICKTKESCIKWLQYMELLPNSMNCPSCKKSMKHEHVNRLSDGVVWMCTSTKKNKKTCAKRCTVRRGTWFEGTNMSLEQVLYFTYMWINFFPSHQIIFELGISAATFTVWDKFFRRVCGQYMQEQGSNFSNDLILGTWLQAKKGQDAFICFLRDASFFHGKDTVNI